MSPWRLPPNAIHLFPLVCLYRIFLLFIYHLIYSRTMTAQCRYSLNAFEYWIQGNNYHYFCCCLESRSHHAAQVGLELGILPQPLKCRGVNDVCHLTCSLLIRQFSLKKFLQVHVCDPGPQKSGVLPSSLDSGTENLWTLPYMEKGRVCTKPASFPSDEWDVTTGSIRSLAACRANQLPISALPHYADKPHMSHVPGYFSHAPTVGTGLRLKQTLPWQWQ